MPNAQIEDPRAFERFLRDNGFSRSRAKTITAKGFRGRDTDALDIHEATEVIELLRERKNALNAIYKADYHGACKDCAPCRKAANNDARCEALKNDIIDGNISRWKARRQLVWAVNRLSIQTKKFVEAKKREGTGVIINGLDTIYSAAELYVTRQPAAFADFIRSAVTLVQRINSYFGDYDDEYKKFIRQYKSAVERAKDNAEYLDRIFWQQVNAHKREGCSTLPSSTFNQPSNLRF